MAIENVKYVDLMTPDSSIVYLVNGSDENWKIHVTDGQEVWSSIVSPDDIVKEATVMSQTKDDYLKNFKKALMNSTTNGDGSEFIYSMKKAKSAGEYLFTYSRRLEDEGINVLLGKIRLKCIENIPEQKSVILNIMKSLHSSKQAIAQKNRQLETDVENEKSLCTEAKQVLDDFVKEHEENESDLYSNFIHVLNEKKRKLRELRDECESLRAELAAIKDNTEAPISKPSPESVKTKGRGKQQAKRKGAVIKKQSKKEYKFESEGSDTEVDEQELDKEETELRPALSYEPSQLSQIVISSTTTAVVSRIDSDESEATDFEESQPERLDNLVLSKLVPEKHDSSLKIAEVKHIDGGTTQPNGDKQSSCDLDDLLADLSDRKTDSKPATVKRSPAKRSRPDPDAVVRVKRSARSNILQSQDKTSAPAPRRSGRKTAATCSPTLMLDDLLDGI